MNFKIMAAALALSSSWMQLSLNAKPLNPAVENLKNIERIAASIAIVPSVQKLFAQNPADESAKNLALAGDLAQLSYDILSTGLEDGQAIMDLKAFIDSFNTAKNGRDLSTDVAQDAALALAKTTVNMFIQKLAAKTVSAHFGAENQRIVRRSVRALVSAVADALVKASESAIHDKFIEAKDFNTNKVMTDLFATFVITLTKNASNEFAGEMIRSAAENVSPLDLVTTAYSDLTGSIKHMATRSPINEFSESEDDNN